MKETIFSQVIITRPQAQNAKLQERLRQIFLEQRISVPVQSLPLLEIVPILQEDLAKAVQRALTQTQWVSFVSPNAFWMTAQLLEKYTLPWPQHLKIAVVGDGSAQSILDFGLIHQKMIRPKGSGAWDSEGLWEALQAEQADWQNTRMVMMAGEDGRNFLVENLQQAGAHVEEFAVYRRQGLSSDHPAWQSIDFTKPSVWVFNSAQAGAVLQSQWQGSPVRMNCLHNDTAIVSHPRIAEKIKALGFGKVCMIEPGDMALHASLVSLLKTAL